ncbi:MAG: hypothetical protein HYX47_21340 [Burkholderiales bacterium]|nr:hypothetical protein [Burkholderiales bacterium]
MAAYMDNLEWFRNDFSAGLTVLEGEFASVTGDDADAPQLTALVPVLHRLRAAFGMDMVFIGELRNGKLTGREVAPGDGCHPFEEAYGRELLQARCGSALFDAVPVYSREGMEAGTLICGVAARDGRQPSPDSLKSVSRLLATSMRRMACA